MVSIIYFRHRATPFHQEGLCFAQFMFWNNNVCMIEKVAVLGIGLIGGSLSLALKKYHPALHIVGFDVSEALDEALSRKAIDVPAASAEAAVREADVVVLAAPIAKILKLTKQIAPHLKPGTIVTDVGSVKNPIVSYAREVLPEHITFIGGHPMAGSEKSGVHHADPFLFENATYVLCPTEKTDQVTFAKKYADFVALIESVGARIIVLEADRHDRIAAAVSHLPQLLAVALTNYVGRLHDNDDAFLRLAAGGFRDMTRIAGSTFDIWHDILAANEGPVLDMLAGFAAELQKTRNKLIEGDLQRTRQDFEKARSCRNLIPKDSKGFLHPLADVFVYAEDKPGFLFRLTKTLHEAEINIKDMELLKIREGLEGVFRIAFQNLEIADKAIQALTNRGYQAFRM